MTPVVPSTPAGPVDVSGAQRAEWRRLAEAANNGKSWRTFASGTMFNNDVPDGVEDEDGKGIVYDMIDPAVTAYIAFSSPDRVLALLAEVERLSAVGRCGDKRPTLVNFCGLSWCSLPHGHAGWHRDEDGAEWNHTDRDSARAALADAARQAKLDVLDEAIKRCDDSVGTPGDLAWALGVLAELRAEVSGDE